jgi:enterochelin esterase-like enzyme
MTRLVKAILATIVLSLPTYAAGSVSDNIRITSQILGYEIQFRAYIPEGTKKDDALPVVFVSDGQWYLSDGGMAAVLDSEITAGRLQPVITIFVDSGEPGNPKNNRRNDQFMCNPDYAQFYRDELIPTIENAFPVSHAREDRLIMGLSFGGLNAACFGLMIPDSFANIGMHSPASGEHLKLLSDMYGKQAKLPLRMFFSVGTKRDNTKEARKFHKVLMRKGYDVAYTEVPFGHEWDNWRPLIDDMLLTFFAAKP